MFIIYIHKGMYIFTAIDKIMSALTLDLKMFTCEKISTTISIRAIGKIHGIKFVPFILK